MGNGSSAAKSKQARISVDEEPFLLRHSRLKQQKSSSDSSEEEAQPTHQPSQINPQLEIKKEPSRSLFGRRNSHPEIGRTLEVQKAKKALRRKSSKSDEYAGDTDEEVDELETTLNSLGVVGKSLWDDAQAYESMKASNRRNDGKINNRGGDGARRQQDEYFDDDDDAEDEFDVSTISRELPARRIGASSLAKGRRLLGGRRPTKTFQYSWEKNGIKEDEVGDEWEYKGNKIEGVDIEKFKAVNSNNTKTISNKMEEPSSFLSRRKQSVPQETTDAAISAPMSSRDISTTLATIPDYDETDAKLLASIEDEFVY